MKLKDYVKPQVNSTTKAISLQLQKRKMKEDGISDLDILNISINKKAVKKLMEDL